MGALSNLLPGLRDLRTPLAAGYTLLVGLWLLLFDVQGIRRLVHALSREAAPVLAIYGSSTVLAAVSVAAYIVGSLVAVDASKMRISRIGQLLGTPIPDIAFRGRRRSWLLWVLPAEREDSLMLRVAREYRYRIEDVERLQLHVYPNAIWVTERASSGTISTKFVRDIEEYNISTLREPELVIGDNERYWRLTQLDPKSTAIKLHIANRELWDQYDRLNAEAELRFSLVAPGLVLALGVAVTGTWWAGVAFGMLSLGLYRDGDSRARAANGVLIHCLVAGVIRDPALDPTPNPPQRSS